MMLISAYISAIPFSGEGPCMPMQSMSGWPPNKPVHSARMAKVGAAARPSQSAAPEALWLPPAQVSTSTGDIDTSAMTVLVVATPPDALLVAPFGRAVEPLIGAPENVQAARIGR